MSAPWEFRADYLKELSDLRRELSREMNVVQVGEPSVLNTAQLEHVINLRDKYRKMGCGG